jgi:hypothetical protein
LSESFIFSARAVLYNFCGLPPPHNDSPLLVQCLVDLNVIVQLTPDDNSVLRLAADEDVPLVLNSQHLEWEDAPSPLDIVQANDCSCFAIRCVASCQFFKILQISANLLDTAVACAMRRDGFSVSSNGKLGQPADVSGLLKEAQASHSVSVVILFHFLRLRYYIASRCMGAAVQSFKHFSPMFSIRFRCMLGASTGGQSLPN